MIDFEKLIEFGQSSCRCKHRRSTTQKIKTVLPVEESFQKRKSLYGNARMVSQSIL
jgi:hypothetical protein